MQSTKSRLHHNEIKVVVAKWLREYESLTRDMGSKAAQESNTILVVLLLTTFITFNYIRCW